LDLWEQDRAAPLEINVEPGYSGPTPFTQRPQLKFTSMNAVLFGPLSRGRTHITSTDAFQAPALDPAYYAHPLDFETHVRGIELSRKILRRPPLDTIYAGEYEPGNAKDVEVWAREVAASDNHVVGSLAMMPKELGGVVDTRMKMYGIENVRVVGTFRGYFFVFFFHQSCLKLGC
jgi:choline dehydrogenase-like flavoprotein